MGIYKDIAEIIKKEGSRTIFCEKFGVAKQYLSAILQKKRPVPKRVCSLLGYKKTVIYEKIK